MVCRDVCVYVCVCLGCCHHQIYWNKTITILYYMWVLQAKSSTRAQGDYLSAKPSLDINLEGQGSWNNGAEAELH